MPAVAIDLVPIRPGKGGTGSGIWTYARELIVHLDHVAQDASVSIWVLASKEQQRLLPPLRNLRFLVFPAFGRWIGSRLLWVHVVLPVWCMSRRINVLHKLATETPWFCSAKHITTIHDFFHEFMEEQASGSTRPSRKYFRSMARRAISVSRCIITGSNTIAREVKERFPEARAAIEVIPHGCNQSPGQRLLVFNGPLWSIGVIGKIMPYKGQMEALAAFEALRDPAARLILHGFVNDQAFVKRLDQSITKSPLHAHIRRRDYQAKLTLDALYADVDVLLFLSQYEGFGLPVIEAQARGIPVVCSDIPVLREVAGDGACFVDRDNPQQVGSVLERIKVDQHFREALIQKGLINAQRYNWAASASRLYELYQRECRHI